MAGPLDYQFDHIHVFCSNVEATERWFVAGLGAALMERRAARGALTTELRLGGTHVLIRGARKGEQLVPAGVRHFGTDHFGLPAADVDATVAELQRGGHDRRRALGFRPAPADRLRQGTG